MSTHTYPAWDIVKMEIQSTGVFSWTLVTTITLSPCKQDYPPDGIVVSGQRLSPNETPVHQKNQSWR